MIKTSKIQVLQADNLFSFQVLMFNLQALVVAPCLELIVNLQVSTHNPQQELLMIHMLQLQLSHLNNPQLLIHLLQLKLIHQWLEWLQRNMMMPLVMADSEVKILKNHKKEIGHMMKQKLKNKISNKMLPQITVNNHLKDFHNNLQ
jgi:hypothetical protein